MSRTWRWRIAPVRQSIWLTGEAKFLHLHDQPGEDIQNALERASKYIDTILNLIGGSLGLDHDQVFFWPLRRAGDGALSRPAPAA